MCNGDSNHHFSLLGYRGLASLKRLPWLLVVRTYMRHLMLNDAGCKSKYRLSGPRASLSSHVSSGLLIWRLPPLFGLLFSQPKRDGAARPRSEEALPAGSHQQANFLPFCFLRGLSSLLRAVLLRIVREKRRQNKRWHNRWLLESGLRRILHKHGQLGNTLVPCTRLWRHKSALGDKRA